MGTPFETARWLPQLDKLRSQSGKFLAVTRYILSRYGKVLTSYDEAQEFFTEMYQRRMPPSERGTGLRDEVPTIATQPLTRIFPGIVWANVQRLGRYDSLLSNEFKSTTDYSVSPRELLDLCAMVAHLKPSSILEFGTYRGATTANLALNAPVEARIRTIDIDAGLLLDEQTNYIFDERDVERIVADSTRFDFSELEGSVDFIFVDGGHDRKTLEADSRNALRMLSPGGTIVWHDFSADHPDVVEFLGELSKEVRLTHLEATALVVYRR